MIIGLIFSDLLCFDGAIDLPLTTLLGVIAAAASATRYHD